MISPQPSSSFTYRQEDVQQILNLAIARKTHQAEFSREQLKEIAQELEIDEATLALAELDWIKQGQITQLHQEFQQYRQDHLKNKLVRYGIVNGFLMTLNLMGGGLSWSLYILLIWGIPLSLAAWQTFQTQGKAYEEAFERWRVKNEVKQSLITFWDKLKQLWQ